MFFNRAMLSPFDLQAAQKFANSSGQAFKLAARNAKGSDPAQLLIYEGVGLDRFDGTGITATEVASFMADNRGKPVDVLINSPGGLVYDGLSIYNALISHNATVTTTVTGIAASIASIIVQAGDTRRAYSASSMMIHRAMGACVGNVADMTDCGVWLNSIDNQLADLYATRSGQSKARMLDLMRGEVDGTLFDAGEAKRLGLLDQIIGNDGKSARNHNPRQPSGVRERLDGLDADNKVHAARKQAERRQRELATV